MAERLQGDPSDVQECAVSETWRQGSECEPGLGVTERGGEVRVARCYHLGISKDGRRPANAREA
jgi:hypothetical protein